MMTSKLFLTAAVIFTPTLTPVAMAQSSAASSDGEDQIIVTGSPLARVSSETLYSISVVEADELQRKGASTIGEALRTQPGVNSTFFGAGASRPIIRGQGGDRVRVLDNGIGSIDASSSSPDHAVAVEPALATRVEILRGPGVLRYGSSGASGIVNVIDGRLPTETPEGDIDGALRIGGSSVDEGRDLAGGVTIKAGEIGDVDILLHAQSTWRETEDYDIPGFAESAAFRALEEDDHDEEHEGEDHEEEEEARDILPNSFTESQSIAGGLSFIGEKGFFSFAVKQFETTYGIPGGHEHAHEEGEEEEEEGEEEENVFIDLEQTRYDIKARYDFGGAVIEAVTLDAGLADYSHIEFEGPGEVGTVFSNEGWEARLEAIQAIRGNWRGATGLKLRQRDFSALGQEAFVPPTVTDQYGIYTFQELRFGDILTEAALRYEHTEHEREEDSFTRSFDATSVALSGQYNFDNNLRISGNIFRTERAPTTEELFANGPHLATGQFEIGDVNLDKEVATGVEGITSIDGDWGQLQIALFYTSYEDYIYEVATGEEEDELPVFMFMTNDATLQGVEIEAGLNLWAAGAFDFSGDAVIDMVQAELDVEGNDNIPRIPPLGTTIGFNANSAILDARAEMEYAAEQDSISNFELPTDDYTLFNLYVDWRPFQEAQDLTISAAVLNASDKQARVHSSFLKDEVPLPGRNYRLSVRYAF
ncbi:MAG: TonB-dependent receptor [Pseudomonadota bacterium]